MTGHDIESGYGFVEVTCIEVFDETVPKRFEVDGTVDGQWY